MYKNEGLFSGDLIPSKPAGPEAISRGPAGGAWDPAGKTLSPLGPLTGVRSPLSGPKLSRLWKIISPVLCTKLF